MASLKGANMHRGLRSIEWVAGDDASLSVETGCSDGPLIPLSLIATLYLSLALFLPLLLSRSDRWEPRLTTSHPAIQFVPKMFYRVEVRTLGGPVQSANIVVGVSMHKPGTDKDKSQHLPWRDFGNPWRPEIRVTGPGFEPATSRKVYHLAKAWCDCENSFVTGPQQPSCSLVLATCSSSAVQPGLATAVHLSVWQDEETLTRSRRFSYDDVQGWLVTLILAFGVWLKTLMAPRCFSGCTARLLPLRTGFDSRQGRRSRIFEFGNRAGRRHSSAGFSQRSPLFRPFVPAVLHTHLAPLSSDLKTSISSTQSPLQVPNTFNSVDHVTLTVVYDRGHPPPHQGEPGSIPCRVAGFSHVGFVPDDAVGQRVFSEISRYPTPLHSSAAPYSFQSPLSALKTSLLRAAQISSLFNPPPQ
ncbi:hypothetical protein PR048_008534 [Dryococelus australis]|uniref:Uncharacterized protein n=1 Tax=Dryococelus australis TaxID=614101 RepID=A0ABQ9HXG1_9NEOP|nr:hypothetical protein PR048_008534 [Dryococelus australis]